MKPLLVLMASVLLLAAVLLCCSLETPSAFEPIVVEIIPSSLGAGVNDYENCLLVNGVARTWAEFAQYLKQRAAMLPGRTASSVKTPERKIEVHIRTGRDTLGKVAQFALVVCYICGNMEGILGVTGEPREYRLGDYYLWEQCVDYVDGPEAERGDPDAEISPENGRTLDHDQVLRRFDVFALCRVRDERPYWSVRKTECYNASQLEQALRREADNASRNQTVFVWADVFPDAKYGAIYDCYAVADRAGFQNILVSPLRVSIKDWPESVLKACEFLNPRLGWR
ncbi:MAG: hypothetical protein WC712_10305 [Candidatus Brocadiia bacterium]